MSNLRFREQGTTPADAAAGQVQMYAKTDGKLYTKRGGDAETRVTDASSGGKILQVLSTTKTDHTSMTGTVGDHPYTVPGTDQDGNGSIWSVTITPSNASNKIMLVGDVAMGMNNFHSYNFFWAFYRSIGGATATPIGIATEGTDTKATGGFNMYTSDWSVPFLFGATKQFMDTPNTTSEVKYHIQVGSDDANAVMYVNRRGVSAASGGTSTITAWEIAG
jgi:hypothetical protein